jgi:tetratricopeptide (TPR) repeat protein
MIKEFLEDINFIKKLHKFLQRRLGHILSIALELLIIIIFIVIVAFVFSDKIKQIPVVNSAYSWIIQKPLPSVDPNYFTVLVAHLENDKEREIENLIIESLKELKEIQLRKLDRNIRVRDAYTEKTEQESHEQARVYLHKTGAQVLIWGTVIKASGKSLPKLYWTVTENLQQKKTFERYLPTENLSLPVIFWEDLADVLRLLIITKYTQFHASQGKYIGDEIKPFIEKLRRVLKYHKEKSGWTNREYAQVMHILAESLSFFGEESGKNEPLEEAILAYREALKEWTRERVPLYWAGTQNNLGLALSNLGERESGTKRLEEAVVAYNEALKEYTRERVPLDWALTQNNLGNALCRFGKRESETKKLEEAVAAYREALKERTRARVPLDWAMTQNNLGAALLIIGERENGIKRLEEAAAAFHEALKEYTRERVPLNWAMTQSNMGTALSSLGKRESGTKHLEEAIAAFREALKEQTRERVPLNWAMTQNNMGTALSDLGEREGDTKHLEEAEAAYREALKEYTRERVPLEWKETQRELSGTLEMIRKRKIKY